MKLSSNNLKGLLTKFDQEIVVVELGAWAAYHGDWLDKADQQRVLLAIRRFETLREAVSARIK
jgi:hypothetical protein